MSRSGRIIAVETNFPVTLDVETTDGIKGKRRYTITGIAWGGFVGAVKLTGSIAEVVSKLTGLHVIFNVGRDRDGGSTITEIFTDEDTTKLRG